MNPFFLGILMGAFGFAGPLGIIGWHLGYDAALRKVNGWLGTPQGDGPHAAASSRPSTFPDDTREAGMSRGRKGYRILVSPEPACRICHCTEFNACPDGCSWVSVEKLSAPLCSACAGTGADLAEAMKRATSALGASGLPSAKIERAITITRAALKRHKARVRADASVIDASWGSR